MAPKTVLKADRDNGVIRIDGETTLSGIPKEAFYYRLGNRSGLEWILDQYKERTPKDPTIRAMFNTYRFADHTEKVIELIARVTRVSVETLALQLRFCFDMCLLSRGLVRWSPERPGDYFSRLNLLSYKTGGDASDFLDRPADQLPVLRLERRIVFGGGIALAR